MSFDHYEPCPRCTERGRDSRGDNLAVYRDGGAHCFSCGLHKFPKHYSRPKKEVNVPTVLPANVNREIPARAWEWLLQYGLPMSYWKPHVWWREEDSRLVFTVGEPVQFSLGRHIPIEGRSFEYKPRKWFVWGNCHKTPHIFGDYRTSKEIVLVEDLISAAKVGMASASIPLFGTKVFDSIIPALRHVGLPVVLWLDKDQEGTLQRKCQWLASLTNLPVRYVVTDKDPKELQLVKIQEVLRETSLSQQ